MNFGFSKDITMTLVTDKFMFTRCLVANVRNRVIANYHIDVRDFY